MGGRSYDGWEESWRVGSNVVMVSEQFDRMNLLVDCRIFATPTQTRHLLQRSRRRIQYGLLQGTQPTLPVGPCGSISQSL